MADTKSQESEEGIWVLDDSGKNLKFISQEFLDSEGREATDRAKPTHPTTEEVAEYLSNISGRQREVYNKLQDQGWDDPAIHNFFTLLDNQRTYICAELRKNRTNEEEIRRLNLVCERGYITDFSHLRRPGTSPADDDYQFQLFLLEENKRQRRVMMGED
ncbi:uncharacterized protein N7483_012265 [Penicillium malachiteum]|uniref:uncharacterized protein n=1 Tax=Penicillium malachiteum TaxID=1324776 RepID=UPI002546F61A|nr:uncharacterized protein N7483_012265 [Penicillium malachiteum]KAJ5715084.1 hypothetical protein N7483_012265 [Penicillium malachiteum]